MNKISKIADVVCEEGDGDWDRNVLLTLAEELTPDATAAIESYDPEGSAQWLKDNGFI